MRRKRAAALLALLCLAALLCGDAVRGFHLLTVRHVVCAAHGELVEADAVGAQAGVDDSGVTGVLPTGDADHHEHCSVAATPTRPHAAKVAGAAFADVGTAEVSAVALPAPADVHSRLALTYAPKQGPPGRGELRRSLTRVAGLRA